MIRELFRGSLDIEPPQWPHAHEESQLAAAGAPGAGSRRNRRLPTSVEHAVHLDADSRTVAENNDDTATTSPQVFVPAIDLAARANYDVPANDTLLVDTPAAPEPTPEAPAPRPRGLQYA